MIRLAWNRPKRVAPNNLAASWLLPVGRLMRKHAGPVRMLFTNILLPGAFLVVMAGVKSEAAVLEFVRQAFEAGFAVGVGSYFQI